MASMLNHARLILNAACDLPQYAVVPVLFTPRTCK